MCVWLPSINSCWFWMCYILCVLILMLSSAECCIVIAAANLIFWALSCQALVYNSHKCTLFSYFITIKAGSSFKYILQQFFVRKIILLSFSLFGTHAKTKTRSNNNIGNVIIFNATLPFFYHIDNIFTDFLTYTALLRNLILFHESINLRSRLIGLLAFFSPDISFVVIVS